MIAIDYLMISPAIDILSRARVLIWESPIIARSKCPHFLKNQQ